MEGEGDEIDLADLTTDGPPADAEFDLDENFLSMLAPGSPLAQFEDEVWVEGQAEFREHDDKRQRVEEEEGRRSGSASPISQALARYLDTRVEPPSEPLPLVLPPRRVIRIPSPDRSPEPEYAADPTIPGFRYCGDDSQRRVACKGEDDIIVEISPEAEDSPVFAALMRRLDEMKKDNTAFTCHVHLKSNLPGRRYISWLQRFSTKKKEASHHSPVPYKLIILEAKEFVEEMGRDRMNSVLLQVSKTAPEARIGLIVIGLNALYMAKRAAPIPHSKAKVEGWMLDVFVKHKCIAYQLVESCTEAADHILYLTEGFFRFLHNKHDPSFLMIFGGQLKPDSHIMVDAKIVEASNTTDRTSEDLGEWIRLISSIPGIGPKVSHGVALAYPSFSRLMDVYCSSEKTEEEKRLLMANLMVPPEHRTRIGEAASSAVYRFFCNSRPDTYF